MMSKKGMCGYTLVELVIAMALGAMVLLATSSLIIAVGSFYADRAARRDFDREVEYIKEEICAWVDENYIEGALFSADGEELVLHTDVGERAIYYVSEEKRLSERLSDSADEFVHLFNYDSISSVLFECTDDFIKCTVRGGNERRAFTVNY